MKWDHFSVTEWTNICDTVTLLIPFAINTKLLEGESYATISSVVPTILELKNHLKVTIENNQFFDIKIVKTMSNQLNMRFNKFIDPNEQEFDAIFLTATLLDPRYALCLNEYQIKSVIKFIDSMKFNASSQEISESNTQSLPLNSFTTVQSMIFSALNTPTVQIESDTSKEVFSYIDYLKTNFMKDFNLGIDYFANSTKDTDLKLSSLKFWFNEIICAKFPKLSKVAVDILTIPATQASSERIFSISGQCLNGRHSLDPIKLEREVMFIYNKSLLKF